MMLKKYTSRVIIGLLLVIMSGAAFAADKAQAEKAIAAAEQAQKKAASVDGEWRDTGKIIKQAKAAAAEGSYDKAVKLADQAARQGKLGYEQAYSQKELRTPYYLK